MHTHTHTHSHVCSCVSGHWCFRIEWWYSLDKLPDMHVALFSVFAGTRCPDNVGEFVHGVHWHCWCVWWKTRPHPGFAISKRVLFEKVCMHAGSTDVSSLKLKKARIAGKECWEATGLWKWLPDARVDDLVTQVFANSFSQRFLLQYDWKRLVLFLPKARPFCMIFVDMFKGLRGLRGGVLCFVKGGVFLLKQKLSKSWVVPLFLLGRVTSFLISL